MWGWDASNHDWGRGPMDLAGVDAVHDRMARERTTGYVIVYAPRSSTPPGGCTEMGWAPATTSGTATTPDPALPGRSPINTGS